MSCHTFSEIRVWAFNFCTLPLKNLESSWMYFTSPIQLSGNYLTWNNWTKLQVSCFLFNSFNQIINIKNKQSCVFFYICLHLDWFESKIYLKIKLAKYLHFLLKYGGCKNKYPQNMTKTPFTKLITSKMFNNKVVQTTIKFALYRWIWVSTFE